MMEIRSEITIRKDGDNVSVRLLGAGEELLALWAIVGLNIADQLGLRKDDLAISLDAISYAMESGIAIDLN